MSKAPKTGLTKKHWFGYMFGDWGGKSALCLGERETAMGRPGMLKMIHTMLTNKAVGE